MFLSAPEGDSKDKRRHLAAIKRQKNKASEDKRRPSATKKDKRRHLAAARQGQRETPSSNRERARETHIIAAGRRQTDPSAADELPEIKKRQQQREFHLSPLNKDPIVSPLGFRV